jgi:hypothetical protein
MPRYFFNVRRGHVTILDREGIELTNVAEAAKEAARRWHDGAGISERGTPLGAGMIVSDEGLRTVSELPFEDSNENRGNLH